MIALLQRVSEAAVRVQGEVIGAIGPGLLVLVCAEPADDEALASRLLDKILKLRIFPDDTGRMNLSVQQTGGALLIVSQFTLAADVSGGNRTGFSGAAEPVLGRHLYEHFVQRAQSCHPVVATGEFGADMQVSLINDGPVTIPLRMSA